MKERDLRRVIVVLLVSVLLSIWWMAFSLHGMDSSMIALVGPSPVMMVSSSSLKHINSKTTNPYFVLHVGPPKTATTSIQCGLDALSGDLAKLDSYYFVGKGCPKWNSTMANGESGIPGHHLMMGLIDANPHSRGFEKLKERMDFHLARGNHMLFSLEAMSNHLEDRPETWKLFLSLFEGWNVRIVVGYRHYFDWIRSMYFQQHIGPKYRERWPHQRGSAHPSFHDFLEYHLERWENGDPSNDGHSWGQHLSLYALQYFTKHFDDVQVFDLHQDADVLTNFICQMLPGATNMCQRLQKDPFKEASVKRESHSFDADRLAMAAYESKILTKDIYRENVVKKTRSELVRTNALSDPKYLACLPEHLVAKFLNASLWFERQVAITGGGDLESVFHRDDNDHRASFQNAARSGKFCEVNTTAILQSEHWTTFFAAMKPKKKL